jgi:hypothetical protein
MGGARTEKRQVLPYASLDGFLTSVRYRHSTNAKFQEIDKDTGTVVVPVDDLRSIPRHELGVNLDESALSSVYKSDIERLLLVVMTRDVTLRKECILYQSPIVGLPATFVLDPAKLKVTSCRTVLPIELNICAVKTVAKPQWPKRRGSRLLSWHLNLVNESKGPRFPWVRKSAADFKNSGLPSTSSYFISLSAEPADLLKDGDTQIEELLEVWVHEDAWIVLQQSNANVGVAGLQRCFVAQVATQILEIAAGPLRKGQEMAEGSVCERMVSHIAAHAKVDATEIEKKLRRESGTAEIAAYVFAAFAVNRAMSRVLEQ